MSKRHRKNVKQQLPTPPAVRKGPGRVAAVLLAGAILVGVGSWAILKPRHSAAQSPAPSAMEGSATSTPVAAIQVKPDFQKLKGRWLRPDGGYVIDVKNVDEGGRMDASYFNPRPIHVAKAEASQDGPTTKVFIELRDANYPGSTYNLAYDPQANRLAGIYYQAALQQSFDVFFVHVE